MTVGELKEAINNLDEGWDDYPVKVWLPGSYIDLGKHLIVVLTSESSILIEGSVSDGSALS